MKGIKFLWSLAIILGASWFWAPQQASATHIVGGDLTYRCLGNNLYEIRLTLRRDCLLGAPDAQFDDPASVGFFDLQSNQLLTFVGFNGQLFMDLNEDDTLNQVFISDCTIAGNDICVHQTTYVDTIFLPFRPSGYAMAYQRCCRNGSLNNIIDPLNTGMTLVAQLSGFAQTECNSSPQFNEYPPIYICVNQPMEIWHFANDFEGDSLVYCLETPLSGGDIILNMPQPPNPPPYAPVNWRPPYNVFNIMGGVPLAIDSQTGLITGTPNTIGQFVVGICVTAYDRETGQLTGKTRRDFQFNVRACNDEPSAAFEAPELTCDSLTVHFTNTSVNSTLYTWFFDYPNPNGPTSTETNPVYTFPGPGYYDVAMAAFDTARVCFDTVVQRIGVFITDVNADFTYDVPACTDSVHLQVTDLSTGMEWPPVMWSWLLTYPGGILVSSEQNPVFSFEVDGEALVYLTLIVADDNGCTSTKIDSFTVRTLDLQLNPDADSICFGDGVLLLFNGDSTLTYTWDPTLGLDLTYPWDPVAYPGLTTTYHVTVTDGLCELTDSIRVNVQQLPDLSFTYDTDCKSLDVAFTNTSTGGVDYHWDFGVEPAADDTSNVVSPVFTYPGPGIYTVVLSSRDGCDVSVSDTITIAVITETFDNEVINCFQTSIELNPDNNPAYTYTWEPAGFLDDPNAPNPVATVDDDTWFYVTVTDPNLPDCPIEDSVLVIVADDFTLDVGEHEIVSCDLTPITLVAVSDGDVVIVWKDENGQVLVENDTLIVGPMDDDATYYVMATDSLGCMKSDSVRILRPDPGFSVDAGPDQTYCDVQTITLNGTSTDPEVSYEWFDMDGNPVGGGPQIEVTPEGPTCYVLIGTDAIGCQESDTVCLTPVILSISADNQGTCLGDPVTITVTVTNGTGVTYDWFPDTGIVSGDGTPTIEVNPTESTTYSVNVSTADGGCEATLTSTVEVYSFDNGGILIDAIPDTIFLTETSQLIVNQDPDYGYAWVASTGEIVDGVFNPFVMPEETTTYIVTVTDAFGCQGTASITVVVENPFCDERDIFLPNAFTPNGDGINDVLYVRGNFITSIDFHIYNRWGQEVFSSNDQNIGWDGLFNGKKLAPDVFGYYLTVNCPNGESYFKKGNITLLE